MLDDLLTFNVFAFFLIFARLGAALAVLPGFGEAMVPVRVRLAIALALALAVFPLLADRLPAMPPTVGGLMLLVFGETVIGLFIGGAARLVLSAIHVAGTVISFQSALGFAQTVDPTAQSQGAIVVGMLSLFSMLMIFATGLHYLMLQGLVDSYELFPAGMPPPFDAFADLVVGYLAKSFMLGVQMATPFIVYGLTFYFCLGVLGKLMPRVQLFFVAMPLQILLSLGILMVVLPVTLMWFFDHFEASLAEFLVSR